MRVFIWLTFFMTLSLVSVTAQAQTSAKETKTTGSISGKVTVGGKPASGIKVVALQGDDFEPKVVAMTSTDANGHYHLQRVPSGNCRVTVDNASFINPETEKGETKKDGEDDKDDDEDDLEDMLDGIMDNASPTLAVKAEEGEEVKGIDFDLLPGGVITGRVTEANGRPIIGEDVHIELAGDKTIFLPSFTLHDKLNVETDDRGIYRAFGLPPGRYTVSVGEKNSEAGTYSWEKVTLPRTYYTDAASNAKPAVIEVSSGSEATNIDIKVSRPRRAETYAIRGRVIDGLTGKPLTNVYVVCDKKEATLSGLYGESDSTGEFRIDKFTPGKYTISVWQYKDKTWYSDPVAFEVYGSDVSGIEIKAYRTASVSGVVIVENTSNPQVLAQLSKLKITTMDSPLHWRLSEGVQVKADGTFRIDGVQPQNQRTSVQLSLQSAGTWFTLLRIERNGIQQPKSIEVQAGENITDVRIVVAYYTAKIRGRITFENGSQPTLPLVSVRAFLTSEQQRIETLKDPTEQDWLDYYSRVKSASVDVKGNFTLEGLPPGEYEITATFLKDLKNEKPSHPPQRLTKTVIVPADGELEVNFTFDLKQPAGEKK